MVFVSMKLTAAIDHVLLPPCRRPRQSTFHRRSSSDGARDEHCAQRAGRGKEGCGRGGYGAVKCGGGEDGRISCVCSKRCCLCFLKSFRAMVYVLGIGTCVLMSSRRSCLARLSGPNLPWSSRASHVYLECPRFYLPHGPVLLRPALVFIPRVSWLVFYVLPMIYPYVRRTSSWPTRIFVGTRLQPTDHRSRSTSPRGTSSARRWTSGR